MIQSPFALLRPFENTLKIAMFDKSDDVRSDKDAATIIGAAESAGLWQEHGNKTVVIREVTDRSIKADGMITDVPSLALCLRWADCQNFVIYEPQKNVLGALHVGWRGLLSGAIPEFFKTLKSAFNISGNEVFVGAGPSLCMDCAEFGVDHEVLTTLPPNFVDGRHANLIAEATRQLLETGVQPSRIDRSHDCTRCMPDSYWTYRGGHKEEVLAGHTNMLVAFLHP
jgi:copper oxidase (laccase) domain-containing protein